MAAGLGESIMYFDYFESDLIGTLLLVGDAAGLRHIHFQGKKHPPVMGDDRERNSSFFAPVKAQLQAYFRGGLKRFDLLLAPVGTAFQVKVWQALRAIPYGGLASYKSIAEAVGKPRAVRAVGGANGRNPIPIIIPCHRVIGSDGSLTGYGGGLEIKQRLIDLEQHADR
jgi:methylated-DNA-[protein]-cysteine S-methyltransferase